MLNEYIIRLVTDINHVCKKYIAKNTTLQGLSLILANNSTVMDNADKELKDILTDYSLGIRNIRMDYNWLDENDIKNKEMVDKQYLDAIPLVKEIEEFTNQILQKQK